MSQIAIPREEVVGLDAIAPGVAGVRVLFANVFGITDGDGWTLVDAGPYHSASPILRWARREVSEHAPQAIILTHAHFDHVGALQQLVDTWNVPVFIHTEEADYLKGVREYPPPDPSVGGGLMARTASLYPRRPATFEGTLRLLPVDGTVPTLPSWQYVHTPGHTAGHISLFRPAGRVLIAGDAFCTTKPESFLAVATQRPELHGPPAYFTTDWDAARESVRRLAALRPLYAASGHGPPMAGADTSALLAELAERFDEIARPASGQYVEHPTRK